MRAPDHIKCPYTGFKKKCADLCMSCPKWVQIQGHNPNTGEAESKWDCADSWLPILLIENSQQQRQTGAAVESFRNEMSAQNKELARHLLQHSPTLKIIGNDDNG